jgi:DNA-binding phage protein
MRQAKHVQRELTELERARVSEARRLVQQDETEIRRLAQNYKHEYDTAHATLQEAIELLKAERVRQGLSLADVQERTGMERPNLSRLENDAEANPTVATLSRYAEALGKKLVVSLSDL